MISTIFKPRPEPAVALISVILTIFGIITLSRADEFAVAAVRQAATILATALLLFGVVALVSFIRGVRVDLSLNRVGVPATVEITEIEHRRIKTRGGLRDRWYIHFRFVDTTGTTREQEAEFLDHEEVSKWKVGEKATIRYHPQHPEIFRWLD